MRSSRTTGHSNEPSNNLEAVTMPIAPQEAFTFDVLSPLSKFEYKETSRKLSAPRPGNLSVIEAILTQRFKSAVTVKLSESSPDSLLKYSPSEKTVFVHPLLASLSPNAITTIVTQLSGLAIALAAEEKSGSNFSQSLVFVHIHDFYRLFLSERKHKGALIPYRAAWEELAKRGADNQLQRAALRRLEVVAERTRILRPRGSIRDTGTITEFDRVCRALSRAYLDEVALAKLGKRLELTEGDLIKILMLPGALGTSNQISLPISSLREKPYLEEAVNRYSRSVTGWKEAALLHAQICEISRDALIEWSKSAPKEYYFRFTAMKREELLKAAKLDIANHQVMREALKFPLLVLGNSNGELFSTVQGHAFFSPGRALDTKVRADEVNTHIEILSQAAQAARQRHEQLRKLEEGFATLSLNTFTQDAQKYFGATPLDIKEAFALQGLVASVSEVGELARLAMISEDDARILARKTPQLVSVLRFRDELRMHRLKLLLPITPLQELVPQVQTHPLAHLRGVFLSWLRDTQCPVGITRGWVPQEADISRAVRGFRILCEVLEGERTPSSLHSELIKQKPKDRIELLSALYSRFSLFLRNSTSVRSFSEFDSALEAGEIRGLLRESPLGIGFTLRTFNELAHELTSHSDQLHNYAEAFARKIGATPTMFASATRTELETLNLYRHAVYEGVDSSVNKDILNDLGNVAHYSLALRELPKITSAYNKVLAAAENVATTQLAELCCGDSKDRSLVLTSFKFALFGANPTGLQRIADSFCTTLKQGVNKQQTLSNEGQRCFFELCAALRSVRADITPLVLGYWTAMANESSTRNRTIETLLSECDQDLVTHLVQKLFSDPVSLRSVMVEEGISPTLREVVLRGAGVERVREALRSLPRGDARTLKVDPRSGPAAEAIAGMNKIDRGVLLGLRTYEKHLLDYRNNLVLRYPLDASQKIENHYARLGVPRNFRPDELATSISALRRILAPDLYRGEDFFDKVQKLCGEVEAAYDVLSTPKKRQVYDLKLNLFGFKGQAAVFPQAVWFGRLVADGTFRMTEGPSKSPSSQQVESSVPLLLNDAAPSGETSQQ